MRYIVLAKKNDVVEWAGSYDYDSVDGIKKANSLISNYCSSIDSPFVEEDLSYVANQGSMSWRLKEFTVTLVLDEASVWNLDPERN